MHLGARGFVHPELIDPETRRGDRARATAPRGELVLTHLRHRAAPLLRFRTRDHVEVRTSPCPCGRTGPRIRCIGRTDDMLIVRGVNVFPSAVREVVGAFAPDVSGHILVRPQAPGVKQEPPLPVSVELARDAPRRRRARRGDPRAAARGARRPDARRAGAVGQPAAQRVQVEAGRALEERCASSRARASTTSRSSAPTGRRRSTSGRACSACRSSSSSRTSTTSPRATSTSTRATAA